MLELANTAWSFAITIMQWVNSVCKSSPTQHGHLQFHNVMREFYRQELAKTARSFASMIMRILYAGASLHSMVICNHDVVCEFYAGARQHGTVFAVTMMRCVNSVCKSSSTQHGHLQFNNAMREFYMKELTKTAGSFAIMIMRSVNSPCRSSPTQHGRLQS